MSDLADRVEVRLRCLTPLWLGDVDRDSGAMKESGLVGSLRFWMEGTLRAMGLKVCNPTSGEPRERCPRPGPQGKPEYCAACEVFGATGKARAFRLELDGLAAVPVFFHLSHAVEATSADRLWKIFGGRETGGEKTRSPAGASEFRFGVQALWSDEPFLVSIRARPGKEDDVYRKLERALCYAASYGGLGAKTQYGFGQVRVASLTVGRRERDLEQLAAEGQEALQRAGGGAVSAGREFTLHPDRFFSLLFELPKTLTGLPDGVSIGTPPPDFDWRYIPCAYDIRYKCSTFNPKTRTGEDRGLRPEVKRRYGAQEARQVFGFMEHGEGQASRVHVSHLYRRQTGGPYYLKVWGDVDDKAGIVRTVREHLRARFPGIQERVGI